MIIHKGFECGELRRGWLSMSIGVNSQSMAALPRELCRERRLGLRARRWTQICREAQRQPRRWVKSEFRRRRRRMVAAISVSLRWASFFQCGPGGAVSFMPLRKSLISLRVKPIPEAKRMRRMRLRASGG
jgi:hypothetical protein